MPRGGDLFYLTDSRRGVVVDIFAPPLMAVASPILDRARQIWGLQIWRLECLELNELKKADPEAYWGRLHQKGKEAGVFNAD